MNSNILLSKKRKTSSETKSPSNPKDQSPNFLHKLYEILSNPQLTSIIHWNENGNAFIIENLNHFIQKVLPVYYKHNNYSSFVRQLNMYDFHKKRDKENKRKFEHNLFHKNNQYLLNQIKRKSKKDKNFQSEVDAFVKISKKRPNKKLLEKYLIHLLTLAQDTTQKQNSLEKNIDILTRENNELIESNQKMLKEITVKTIYSQKLESIILFVLDLLRKKKGSWKGNLITSFLPSHNGETQEEKEFEGEEFINKSKDSVIGLKEKDDDIDQIFNQCIKVLNEKKKEPNESTNGDDVECLMDYNNNKRKNNKLEDIFQNDLSSIEFENNYDVNQNQSTGYINQCFFDS